MSILHFRRVVQCAVLLLLILLPWAGRYEFTGMKGTLFAFDCFGFPFADPLSALQPLLLGILPDWRLLAGAAASLGVALCLGRIFCSWLCPFGLLSELTQTLRPQKKRTPIRRQGFRLRAALLLTGLVLVPVLGVPLLHQISQPGSISLGLLNAAMPLSPKATHTLAEYTLRFLLPFLLPALILLAEIITGRRFWCRWLCPQSVLLSLMACLPSAPRLRRTLSRCVCTKNDARCRAACPLGLDPRSPRSSSPLECTNCGCCVLACRQVHAGNPAALTLSRHDDGKRKSFSSL